MKNGDIGVENASPETIIKALKNAKYEVKEKREEFEISDMVFFGLTGKSNSKAKRDMMGKELGIGYCNTSQFLNRLNDYGITKEEFKEAISKVNNIIDKEKHNE